VSKEVPKADGKICHGVFFAVDNIDPVADVKELVGHPIYAGKMGSIIGIGRTVFLDHRHQFVAHPKLGIVK